MKTMDRVSTEYSGQWRHKMKPIGLFATLPCVLTLFGRTEAPVLQCEILINSADENDNFVLVNDWVDGSKDSHQTLDPDGYQGLFDQQEKRIG